MIGWWIVVSTHSPEERDRADQDARRAAILAQWETGAEGIRWIEQLVKQDKAAKLSGGGYPNRYTAQARDVLPSWRGKIELDAERCALCPPEHLLTIDAWDQI